MSEHDNKQPRKRLRSRSYAITEDTLNDATFDASPSVNASNTQDLSLNQAIALWRKLIASLSQFIRPFGARSDWLVRLTSTKSHTKLAIANPAR